MGSSKTERKPMVNIGMIGHVDHGKTTLVNALSGEWTDRHSEEVKRGISIRLGYADATFRKCPVCSEPTCYTVAEVCKLCGTKTEEVRTVSFVDSPGHEALMATMLSGAAIMDGAVLLIAASEPCPQPQTEEHLMALNIVGIDRIVIAQNKIDLVSREEAIEHHKQIREFVKGTIAENSPIVPISAQQAANIDVLINCIEEIIPTPERPEKEIARMHIARSFDINRPGTPIRDLKGGVVGGSLLKGQLRTGDRLEIRPGRMVTVGGKSTWEPLETEITSIVVGGTQVSKVAPGGLLGIGTTLDPSMTKEDALVGQCAGKPGTLPPTWEKLSVDFQLFKRAVGVKKEEEKVPAIKVGENIMLSAGTSITIGEVKKVTKKTLDLILSRPVCAETGSRVAIGRKIRGRWHLIGAGTIK